MLNVFAASLGEHLGLNGTEASTTTILPSMQTSFLAAQGTAFAHKPLYFAAVTLMLFHLRGTKQNNHPRALAHTHTRSLTRP